MRSTIRIVLCGAAFALAFAFARIDLGARAQFAMRVLVGEGEVFAAESANQFRPGIVYVYRKNGTNWVEAAQLVGPKSAVGDGFGTELALEGSTLFVGAGGNAIHVLTKQG